MSGFRHLFSPDHEAFRQQVRRFVEAEIVPHHRDWELRRSVPRELWLKAGELGFLCCDVPDAYGGPGADWLYNVVLIEEFWRVGASGPGGGFTVHSELVAPYLLCGGSEALKQQWLPKMVRGEAVGALGLTEPGAGSDLQGIRTTAVRDGDDYVINGQKIYISNGINCDFIVLACKTDGAARSKNVSLLLVEADRPGFDKGRNLEKIGFHAQDTAELFFSDVRVPAGNLIGQENGGFKVLMSNLVLERLAQAVRSMTVCEAALDWTVDHVRERRAFDRTIGDFQNTQFVLADLDARTTSARIYTDWCIERYMRGELDSIHAAKVKMISTELQGEVLDKCLQFFGGSGYMADMPIARAYVDARMTRIAGGAVEVMKQIIAKDMFTRARD